jgi:hypothetical protein
MISLVPNVFHSVPDDRSGEDLSALTPAKAAVSITVAEMKAVLREADCLYDKAEIWKQLGAKNVPEIPDSVIQEAYERGGRIIFRNSSIGEMIRCLPEESRNRVHIWEDIEPKSLTDFLNSKNFQAKWIIVPSHVDLSTLGKSKGEVVTSDNPAPLIVDSFAVRAYALLDGQRQPKGCENVFEYTSGPGYIGSYRHRRSENDPFFVHIHLQLPGRNAGLGGELTRGAAGFGPARICKLDSEKVGESKESIVTTTQVGSLGLGLLSPGVKIKDISPSASDDFSL